MSRKFRPAQCPKCRQYGFSNGKHLCSGGGLGVIRRDDHPVKLVGVTNSSCPDYEPKTEEVSK